MDYVPGNIIHAQDPRGPATVGIRTCPLQDRRRSEIAFTPPAGHRVGEDNHQEGQSYQR